MGIVRPQHPRNKPHHPYGPCPKCRGFRPGTVWRCSWWRTSWDPGTTNKKSSTYRTREAAERKAVSLRTFRDDLSFITIERQAVLRGKWEEVRS